MKKIIRDNRNVKWLLGLIILLLSQQQAYAQQQVTGKVTTTEGMPLPGVNVIEKNTNNGVITDYDGNFSIGTRSANAILVISYVGFETQEIQIGNQSNINIELTADLAALDEVVVIGYGTQSRETVTGAISTIKADEFNTGMINDPLTLISGKVAGLATGSPSSDPNAIPDFSLRGPATVEGNSQPLIVIDGVPGGNLQTIAPADIASIDVLKDGSAAAIYGSRATAGVIIITTKKGTPGKTTLNYSGEVSTNIIANKYDVLNADQYRQVANEHGFNVDDAGADTDWFDEVTRQQLSQSHNISLGGGGENTTYYASLNYRNFQGMDLVSEREFLNGTFRLNTKALNDKLEFSFMVANTYDTRDFASHGALGQALKMNPTFPVRNPDGSFYERPDIQYGLQWNPVANMHYNSNNSKEKKLLSNAKLDYHVLPGLKATASYSLLKDDYLGGSFSSRDDFFQVRENVGGQASRSFHQMTTNILETTLGYNTSFNDHNLDLIGGYSFQNTFNEGFSAGNNNFNTDAFRFNNLGAGTAFNNLTPNFNRNGAFVGSFANERTLVAFFGRAIYDFDRRFLFNVSLRREGASVLGRDNKWGDFFGASAGWVLSRESFMEDIDFVKNLKIRGGYGVTGNQESLSPYQSLATIGPFFGGTQNGYFGVPGDSRWIQPYGPNINPNPALQWETKTEVNLGVDFVLGGNGWLSGAVDYYNRKIKNLVGNYSAQLPAHIHPNIFANAGEMVNEGVEVALTAHWISSPRIRWNTTFTGAYNRNEIVSVTSDQFRGSAHDITNIVQGVSVQRLAAGQPVAAFYGRVFSGFSNDGDWLFQNSAGETVPASEIGDSDRQYLGNSIPKYNVGLTNSVSFGNFDLSMLLRGALDFKAVNAKRLYHENLTVFARQNLFTSAMDNGIEAPPTFSSYYLEDGDYLRIENLTIGYSFPLESSNYVQNIRIFATGTNLATFTKFSGNDPDLGVNYYPSYGEVSNGPGVEPLYSYYPLTTGLTFGINATF